MNGTNSDKTVIPQKEELHPISWKRVFSQKTADYDVVVIMKNIRIVEVPISYIKAKVFIFRFKLMVVKHKDEEQQKNKDHPEPPASNEKTCFSGKFGVDSLLMPETIKMAHDTCRVQEYFGHDIAYTADTDEPSICIEREEQQLRGLMNLNHLELQFEYSDDSDLSRLYENRQTER
ncbi:hypothetical protein J5N97_016199 [Dioscorea zingiberensis]|uniref:Uncharacterized protein n=1 Tax=Dioscorea zingiberensis TaxID=325984 RepID=A0A9D5CJW3_9LILI|nr:hypothetical protein J5N97_016199 [Dioscorea zingiberensis]